MTHCALRFFLGLGLLCGLSGVAMAERPALHLSATVQCLGAKHFQVRADGERAVVQVGSAVLTLRRSASTSMIRYSGPTAALAIEGEYVAFVMDDTLNFEGCRLDRGDADTVAETM